MASVPAEFWALFLLICGVCILCIWHALAVHLGTQIQLQDLRIRVHELKREKERRLAEVLGRQSESGEVLYAEVVGDEASEQPNTDEASAEMKHAA